LWQNTFLWISGSSYGQATKQFLKLLLTESPGLAESTLEQKVNDFAARTWERSLWWVSGRMSG
jgi:hypothetical protein